jgi:hypothetical protein
MLRLNRAIPLCLALLVAGLLCAQAKAPRAVPRTGAAGQQQSEAGPSAGPQIGLLERARNGAASFTEKLPNFVCQQVTNRYRSWSGGRGWELADVISASLVIEEGKESYGNIAVNGEPVAAGVEDLSGTWSTGEFATLLSHLFSPSAQARFVYETEAVQSRLPAAVYAYQVDQPNSNWEITVNGVSVKAAYRGRVWIDKDNARVMRIEMQAENLPGKFPLSRVETTLDYEFVEIGGQRLLLPVRSENLSCERFTYSCTRNAIEFRDYHRYMSESKVTFEKKDKP